MAKMANHTAVCAQEPRASAADCPVREQICFAFRDTGYCRRGSSCPRRHVAGPLAAQGARYAISLGSTCLAARLLGDARCRAFATPFDWIFSSPRMVTHCLRDGFAAFLDRDQYVEHGNASRQCAVGHELYSAMLGHDVIFNHHDPRTDDGHSYFERAVQRLQMILGGAGVAGVDKVGGRKLFVILGLEHRNELKLTELEDLFDTLRGGSSGGGGGGGDKIEGMHHSGGVELSGARNFELLCVKIRIATVPDPSRGAVHGVSDNGVNHCDRGGSPHDIQDADCALPRLEQLLARATTATDNDSATSANACSGEYVGERLEVYELHCRGGLGPLGLSLSDKADRDCLLDLLLRAGGRRLDRSSALEPDPLLIAAQPPAHLLASAAAPPAAASSATAWAATPPCRTTAQDSSAGGKYGDCYLVAPKSVRGPCAQWQPKKAVHAATPPVVNSDATAGANVPVVPARMPCTGGKYGDCYLVAPKSVRGVAVRCAKGHHGEDCATCTGRH